MHHILVQLIGWNHPHHLSHESHNVAKKQHSYHLHLETVDKKVVQHNKEVLCGRYTCKIGFN